MRISDRVSQVIKQAMATCGVRPVVIGVSGGVDSVVLLHALNAMSKSEGLSLIVCHVHHGIRGEEADRDENFVSDLARKYGLRFEGIRVNVPAVCKETGESVETAARRVRYDAFTEVADRFGPCLIVTAHHQQDQVETILDHVLRGSGSRGIAGMRLTRDMGVHAIVRPLLPCSKEQILDYASAQRLVYFEDSTNVELHYRRNRLRHELLPHLRETYNEQIDTALIRLGEIAACEDEYLTELAEEHLQAVTKFEQDGATCNLAGLRVLPCALQRRVLKLVLGYVDKGVPWGFHHVESLRMAINQHALGERPLVRGWIAAFSYDAVHIKRCVSSPIQPQRLWTPTIVDWSSFFSLVIPKWTIKSSEKGPKPAYSKNKWEAWFHREPGDQFILRPHWQGDRISPLGMQGSRLLSDLFIDAKVPKSLRIGYPVLTDGDAILWVPGLCRGRTHLIDGSEQVVQHIIITTSI